MRDLRRAGVAFGLAALSVGAAWKTGFIDRLIDKSHGAIAACEVETMKSLRSPSTYKRVWADYTTAPPLGWKESAKLRQTQCEPDCTEADRFFNAYANKMDKDIERKIRRGERLNELEQSITDRRGELDRLISANAPEVQTAVVTLEYDAQNAFGSPVRSFAMCRFSAIGEDGRFESHDIVSAAPLDDQDGRQMKKIGELTSP